MPFGACTFTLENVILLALLSLILFTSNAILLFEKTFAFSLTSFVLNVLYNYPNRSVLARKALIFLCSKSNWPIARDIGMYSCVVCKYSYASLFALIKCLLSATTAAQTT